MNFENLHVSPRTLSEESLKSGLQLSSTGMITWYCLIISLVVPFCLCSIFIWYTKHRSHLRAQIALDRERELDDDLTLARIEANVQIYSEAEKYVRAKIVRVAVKKHVKVRRMNHIFLSFLVYGVELMVPFPLPFQLLTETDVQSQNCGEGENENAAKPTKEFSSDSSKVCSICLENFKAGDSCAHASTAICRHEFHEDCIVSWLVARQNDLCPCCRQPFTCINPRTPQTSIASVEQSSTIMGESEIRRESFFLDAEDREPQSSVSPLSTTLEETKEGNKNADSDDAEERTCVTN